MYREILEKELVPVVRAMPMHASRVTFQHDTFVLFGKAVFYALLEQADYEEALIGKPFTEATIQSTLQEVSKRG